MQEKIEHFNSENTYIVGHSLQMIEQDAERIKETFSLTLYLFITNLVSLKAATSSMLKYLKSHTRLLLS